MAVGEARTALIRGSSTTSPIDRFNEGCLFWVYMGHGQTRSVDRCARPKARITFSTCEIARNCHARARSPIALLLCCSTGGFDQRDDCLAEELVCAPEGPVAAMAGSRVTMPYAMSVLGAEMLRIYFHERCTTVGDLLEAAKRAMMLRSDAATLTARRSTLWPKCSTRPARTSPSSGPSIWICST